MRTITRQLDRLETVYPAGPGGHDRAAYRAWLRTRSDAELELMESVAAMIAVGGDPADLGAATCAALARIAGTWETFTVEATP